MTVCSWNTWLDGAWEEAEFEQFTYLFYLFYIIYLLIYLFF